MQRNILIWILVINTIIAVLYLIIGIVRKKKKDQDRGHRMKYILASSVIFICPVVGVCFLILSHVLYIILSNREVDMEDVSFSRRRIQVYLPADIKRDINIVPMADALNVSDVKHRRQMLLDVLKKDARRALGSLSLAINNEDSETSHYAASVLTDALAEFRGNVQNLLNNFEKNPEDSQIGMLILKTLSDVLRKNILTGIEKMHYTYLADRVGDTIFEGNKETLKAENYRALTEILLEADDYQNAKKWGDRALEYQPNSVESYICNLKLYFKWEKREAFFSCMDRLKASDLAVDKNVMEYIRLFQQEVKE